MKKFNTNWWSCEIPSEWSAEVDDICTTFTANPPIGSLQISSAKKENGHVTDNDLLEFAEENLALCSTPITIKLNDIDGFNFSYTKEGFIFREWWLRRKSVLVYVTYTCEIKQKNQDITEIEQIIKSLKIK